MVKNIKGEAQGELIMVAKAAGKASWTAGPENSPEMEMEELTVAAMSRVLEINQRAIVHLVNTKDSQRLVALQACLNKLLEQADECLSQGKRMAIAGDIDKGWN